MESIIVAQCPLEKKDYVITFQPLSNETFLQKIFYETKELFTRWSFTSFANAWRIGSENDLSKTLAYSSKEKSLISKCITPKGTIYLTANPAIMRAVLQNYRKDQEGVFYDHENTKLFIKGILLDLFPKDIKHIGIEKAAEMIIFTASSPFVKSLRAPLISILSPNSVKDYIPKMNDIADEILHSLSSQEKENCNVEQLAFEFLSPLFQNW